MYADGRAHWWSVQGPQGHSVPDAKADPVLRRYALRRLRVPVGTRMLSLVVPDARDWIRRGQWAAATERGAEPPYWVQVWPASVAVARLLGRAREWHGRRVLDLGCGLGLPGLAAVAAGCEVTFADRETDALAFAAWNGSRIAVSAPPKTHRLDWSREVVPGRFDLLVLADVSYRKLHHDALRRHVESCLEPEGVVLHADPNRTESSSFVEWLRQDRVSAVTSVETNFEGRGLAVRLVVASRTESSLLPWRQILSRTGDNPAVSR